MDRDGALQSMEVKGMMTVEIKEAEFSKSMLKINKDQIDQLTYTVNPDLHRVRFNKTGVLALKEASNSFPLDTSITLIKWRTQGKDESEVPITVTCWPSPAKDVLSVSLEYEVQKPSFQLFDLVITVPIPNGFTPVIEDDGGDVRFNARSHELVWQMELVDESNSNQTIRFSLPSSASPSALFPINLTFRSSTTFSGLKVTDAASMEGNTPVQFSQEISCLTEGYHIV